MTATLLALVTVKHCSDLTLLCMDNQQLFLQCHTAIFIPISGGKMDQPGHLPPQIHIESHFNVNLCPVFYLKAYLRYTEPFRKKPDGLHVTFLFLGNNRQQGHSVLKPFLLGLGKFSVLLRHMSLGGCSLCSWCFPSVHLAGG